MPHSPRIAGYWRPILSIALALGLPACSQTQGPPGAAAPAAMTASGPEAEARAAFQHLVEVSRQRNLTEFKKLIRAQDLREMETMDKERPGLFEMMMGFVAADNPGDFTLGIKGPVATFTKRTDTRTADSTSRETTTVTLVREGDRWLFGKPR